MRLYDVIWNEKFVAKIAGKHAISTDEVEAVLFSRPHVRKLEKGKVKGEHLYVAYGQTAAGAACGGILYSQAPRRGLADLSAGDDGRRAEILP